MGFAQEKKRDGDVRFFILVDTNNKKLYKLHKLHNENI